MPPLVRTRARPARRLAASLRVSVETWSPPNRARASDSPGDEPGYPRVRRDRRADTLLNDHDTATAHSVVADSASGKGQSDGEFRLRRDNRRLGFGGSVAALRAAEKGYRVGVMESGKRWRDEDIPKTEWDLPKFLWFPGERAVRDPKNGVPRRRSDSQWSGRRRRLTRLRQHPVRPAEAVLRRAGVGGHHRLGRRARARTSIRHSGCSESSATRTCRRTWTAR